ncbi:MAG TPA: helix-turn-helix domain-containing protein [Candidatus Obscuribacterales bacterium]
MLCLSYEYKLKPTKEQIAKIEHILTVCQKVWNFALRERKDWVNSRKCRVDACSLSGEYIISANEPFSGYNLQSKRLTEAKNTNQELKSVNAQVLQQVLRTLDRAWDNIRQRGFGYPKNLPIYRRECQKKKISEQLESRSRFPFPTDCS